MPFKPKGPGKSPNDLMGLLVNSKIASENNALYQTIFGLISLQTNDEKAVKEALQLLKNQIDGIDTSKTEPIPAFFFMGSS